MSGPPEAAMLAAFTGRVAALAEAGVPPLLILEATRTALDVELGGAVEVVHEVSGLIGDEQLCLRCGRTIPQHEARPWEAGELVYEVFRWGEPVEMHGARLVCKYVPASGAPTWCAWAVGPVER